LSLRESFCLIRSPDPEIVPIFNTSLPDQ